MMRLLSTSSADVVLALSSRPLRGLMIVFYGLPTDRIVNVDLRIVYGQNKISDELCDRCLSVFHRLLARVNTVSPTVLSIS